MISRAALATQTRSQGFRISNQFPHRNLQPRADTLNRRRPEILLAPFQLAVIPAVHVNVVREVFLSVICGFPPRADRLANPLLNEATFHGLPK